MDLAAQVALALVTVGVVVLAVYLRHKKLKEEQERRQRAAPSKPVTHRRGVPPSTTPKNRSR